MSESGLDQQFLEEFAPRWWTAWNERDADAIAAMITEDIVYHNPAVGEDLHGRAAMIEYAGLLAQAFADGHFTATEPPYASLTQPKAIVPFHFEGTQKGDFVPMGLKATGGRLVVSGVEHWWFRDGRICRHRSIYDFAAALRSLTTTATE